MSADVKRKALAFMLITIIATLLIGAALPRLVLQPGLPPPSFENGQVVVQPAPTEEPVGVPVSVFFIVLFVLAAAGLLGYVIYQLLKGIPWKSLLSTAFSILIGLIIVLGFFYLLASVLPHSEAPASAVPIPTPKPVITAPLGPTPPILIWIVGIAILVGIVLLGIWIAASRPTTSPELWKLEAEKARAALLDGQDVKNVILHCYRQMSRALWEDRQIEREAYMTTGEFERLLGAKGVPKGPVHQLTGLFEAVRYGRWQPAAGDEQRAIRCLEDILEYSREAGQEE